MGSSQRLNGNFSTGTKWPAHDADKGRIRFGQEDDLLRHGIRIEFVVAGVGDEETNQGATGELGTIVELFLCYVGPL